ncbi:helix-turn-helix domain-containing protein [Streptomyces axinellae]|uniref:Helix-turn-helix domain-containing protein n=1 Tax=Streptomyces axinellae TaxID=552788 RepID=A0ABN3R017_9ACTN
MSDRPMLTQRQAADACEVSRTTIRRRREEGAFPNAVLSEGTWRIPVEDLLAAGLRLHAPAPPDPGHDDGQEEAAAGVGAGESPGHTMATLTEVERLRAELAELRREAAEAEAGRRAAEAEARVLREMDAARIAHIADLQQALAALAPAPERAEIPASRPRPVSEAPASPASPEQPGADGGAQEPGPRRRWWGGRR